MKLLFWQAVFHGLLLESRNEISPFCPTNISNLAVGEASARSSQNVFPPQLRKCFFWGRPPNAGRPELCACFFVLPRKPGPASSLKWDLIHGRCFGMEVEANPAHHGPSPWFVPFFPSVTKPTVRETHAAPRFFFLRRWGRGPLDGLPRPRTCSQQTGTNAWRGALAFAFPPGGDLTTVRPKLRSGKKQRQMAQYVPVLTNHLLFSRHTSPLGCRWGGGVLGRMAPQSRLHALVGKSARPYFPFFPGRPYRRASNVVECASFFFAHGPCARVFERASAN